jgi:hypothetical protein
MYDSFQKRWSHAAWFFRACGVFLEDFLRCVPDLFVDDSFVLALIDSIHMLNASLIIRIFQDTLDGFALEHLSARSFSGFELFDFRCPGLLSKCATSTQNSPDRK